MSVHRRRYLRLTRRLRVEPLEQRRLLAGDLLTESIATFDGGLQSLSLSASAEGEFVPGPWTNPVNRFDANGDGFVSTPDALTVFGARGNPEIVGQECADASIAGTVSFCLLPTPKPAGLPFVDISGDGLITDDDGQQLAAFISGADPAIYVSPQPNRFRLSTTESGGTAIFSVSLIPAPTADVTITVTSSNTAEGTVSTSLLTFTPTQTIHQVTVTGVPDNVDDGDQDYAIQFGTAVSTDPNYNGKTTDDLPMLNIDSATVTTLDFGDLPNTYSTLLADDGPRHVTGSLFLGSRVDGELDATPSIAADGDGDDEDGVTQYTGLFANSSSVTTGSFLVTSSQPGKLDAWMDFNGNGSFEHPAEHITDGISIDLSAGLNVVPVQIPVGTLAGQTATRFRLSTAGGLAPTGAAADGEVEDYFFELLDGSEPSDILLAPLDGNARLSTSGNDVAVASGSVEFFRVNRDSITTLRINGNAADNTLEIANVDSVFSEMLRADGGSGSDRLVFTGSNQAIDLTSIPLGDLVGFEVIDLTGSGDNSISLNPSSVQALSNPAGLLKLIYDAGDTVDFKTGWIVQRPEIIDGLYQHVVTSSVGNARIEITNSFPHQNPVDPLDTNRMDGATVIDPLLVINAIARSEGGPLSTPTTEAEIPDFYLDVRADNELTTIDALRIINFLALTSVGQSEMPIELFSPDEDDRFDAAATMAHDMLQFLNLQRTQPASSWSVSTDRNTAASPTTLQGPTQTLEPLSSDRETEYELLDSRLAQPIQQIKLRKI